MMMCFLYNTAERVKKMYQILRKEQLNPTVELMEIYAPYVARKCEPGQFIILRVDEQGERIPLTIADFNREKETITIIYQVVGYSTQELAKKQAGDYLADFAGPLGEPTKLPECSHVIGIAGGVGAAPLYPQLRKLAENGVHVDVIIGAKNQDYILYEKEMAAFCDHVYLATEDGSAGTKGFVTTVLNQLLETEQTIGEVIAIGPVPMMKAVVDVTKPRNIPTSVSLNPIMIDGTGMCGCCRVTVDGKIRFACVDGPDFDGLQVDFDELMRRQRMFKHEEKQVLCHMSQIRGEE